MLFGLVCQNVFGTDWGDASKYTGICRSQDIS